MSNDSFEVRWAEEAVRDLEEIVAYIAQDAPAEAHRQLARIRERAESLKDMPRRGRAPPELAHFGIRSWRELIIRPWRLVYRIEEARVVVLALLDGRRDLEDLLLERLTR